MLYYLTIQIGEKRQVIILENDLEQANYWACWFADEKHNNGEGDTLQQAINNMFTGMEYRREMWRVSRWVSGSTVWYPASIVNNYGV